MRVGGKSECFKNNGPSAYLFEHAIYRLVWHLEKESNTCTYSGPSILRPPMGPRK